MNLENRSYDQTSGSKTVTGRFRLRPDNNMSPPLAGDRLDAWVWGRPDDVRMVPSGHHSVSIA